MAPGRLALLCACLLLVMPTAGADAHPPQREFETRVLEDADLLPAVDGGQDLLALDVREATDPTNGAASLVLRLLAQGGDPEKGVLGTDIHFTAGGEAHVLGLRTDDGKTYTGEGFYRVRGPVPQGDAFAVEGWVPIAELGLSTGDVLEDLRVEGSVGDEPADAMPGGHHVGGVLLPGDPDQEEARTYTLTGIAPLVLLELDDAPLRLAPGEKATRTLTLRSGLEETSQQVMLEAVAPEGVTATFSSTEPELEPGAALELELEVQADALVQDVLRVRIVSGLGDLSQAVLTLHRGGEAGDGTDLVSGDLEPGDVFAYTFLAEGTFLYHCHPHPWMEGSIEVLPEEGAPQVHAVRIVEPDDAWRFSPAGLRIHVGDTVVWTNEGEDVHDIMGHMEGMTGGHDDHDHGHDHSDHDHGADVPGPALPALFALLALLVLRRRG